VKTTPSRARRNGTQGRPRGPLERKPGRGLWFAPILGATIIVVLAWAASIEQATPEIFVAASLVFSICEGIVLAFIGCVWSSRGIPLAVLAAVLTGVLAIPGRWEVASLLTHQTPQMLDLLSDLGVTIAWSAFAGLAGATILRERLAALLPWGDRS
jgi:hypothetical protein